MNGNVPMGALHDPRAPWNWGDNMTECDCCKGTGYIYYAYNFVTRESTECSEEDYYKLPDSIGATFAFGGQLIKGEIEICQECDGQGEVKREPYEREYFAEDKYGY